MAWPLNALNYAKYSGVDPADGFHVYALEWDEQEIRWFVDGNHFHTVRRSTYWNFHKDPETNAHTPGSDSAPFDRPFHLLLNLAVGGNLPGAPTPGALPSELRVDYVRVYECNLNAQTGVGCDGFTDFTSPSVTPPLSEDVYRAVYDLYTDAVGPLVFPDTEDTDTLDFGVYDAGGALVLSEVDGGDRGMVIDVDTSGGGNFSIFPASLTRQTFFGMGSASDPGNYAGEIQFDLYVFGAETDADSSIQVKLDSGFPDLGFVDLPVATLTKDAWTTVTVQISDIAHNPGHFGGGPVDLAQVLSLFVLEPTSFAHLQVDNIQILCGHVGQGDCGIIPPAPPPPAAGEPQPVYIDGVDPVWDVGINGADSGTVTGFQAVEGVDVSALASGTLEFDFKEVSPPPAGSVWRLKLESSDAATAVEVLLTDAGNPTPNDEWQHYRFTLGGDLAGLDISAVKLVMIFPDWANADGAVGRIDNVSFVPDVGPIDLYADAPAEGWFLWDCCGAATFGEVEDDDEHGSVIELSFGAGGTVTGLQATSGLDASATAGGMLNFDFKEVSPPPDGSQWHVKLESSGAATAVDILMTAGGNPTPTADWQEYSFELDTEFAGLDLSDLTLVLFFPDWENANGAVARIDNVRLVPPQ